MSEPVHSAPGRSPLATFGLFVVAIALLCAGAVLMMLAGQEAFSVEVAGITLDTGIPGLALIALAFYALFRSGRSVRGGDDDDPESHLPFPRDVRDQIDSIDDER